MASVTMRELLDSGVHFGHQTRRWNPKMKRFIFTERNGIYIIDIQQSLPLIDQAYAFTKDIVAKGGHILFVGTKKQAHAPIINQAARVGMPTVTERWLGGMLTNFPTVLKRIARLKELEALEEKNDLLLTKKELLMLRREREKLFKNLDGIRNMTKLPAAIWVVDTKKEHLAIQEAKKLGIPLSQSLIQTAIQMKLITRFLVTTMRFVQSNFSHALLQMQLQMVLRHVQQMQHQLLLQQNHLLIGRRKFLILRHLLLKQRQ